MNLINRIFNDWVGPNSGNFILADIYRAYNVTYLIPVLARIISGYFDGVWDNEQKFSF